MFCPRDESMLEDLGVLNTLSISLKPESCLIFLFNHLSVSRETALRTHKSPSQGKISPAACPLLRAHTHSCICIPSPGATKPKHHFQKPALLCGLCSPLLIHPSVWTRRLDQLLHHWLIPNFTRWPGSKVWMSPSPRTGPGWWRRCLCV